MSIFNTKYKIRDTRYEKGAALLFTLIVMITLTSVVGAYLAFVQHCTRSTGAQITDSQAIYLAEAGLQKAIWNLKTPEISGGKGEDWKTAGAEEYLGDVSYIMDVETWDWALAANNATASASSSAPGHDPNKAIDDSNDTWWESADQPGTVQSGKHQEIIINFPYTLTINKVRFLAPTFENKPSKYTWAVSTDNVTYTEVSDETKGTDTMDETHEFAAVHNVNYLRLRVTKSGPPSSNVVKVSTIEAIGSKITVTGTVDGISREIEQTVAVDDASEEAYDQIDWSEN